MPPRYLTTPRRRQAPAGLALRAQAELTLRQRTGQSSSAFLAGGPTTIPRRDPAHRAAYANRRADYIAEILGGIVPPDRVQPGRDLGLYRRPQGYFPDQLYRVLELLDQERFILVPGGHNLGKDWLLGAVALHFMDAVAAQPSAEEEGREVGCRVLLVGPTATSVFQTIYTEILDHARRAEARGFALPPGRSLHQPRWHVREKWTMEPLTPQRQVGQGLAHSAGGRHALYQLYVLDEAAGIREEQLAAAEGSASTQNNMVVAIFNPSESHSPITARMRSSLYRVITLSAFDHPNVRSRSYVIPPAIDYKVIDRRVEDCKPMGRVADGVVPDPQRNQFIYALPPSRGAEEIGPRPDGYLGHPHGELAVWEPTGLFEPQVLGVIPKMGDATLFSELAWDQAVQRGRRNAAAFERLTPTRIGVDCAREGDDDTVVTPAWGPDAVGLLSRHSELLRSASATGISPEERIVLLKRLEDLKGTSRVGLPRVAPKGEGPDLAVWIHQRYPNSPWMLDDGSVGVSILDHARRVLHANVTPVSFGGAAPERVEGQLYFADNLRAALYILAASACNLGLVDLPDDPLLRQEVLAVWTIPSTAPRAVLVREKGRLERRMVETRALPSKKELKQMLGRSPDRADSFVLSLWRSTQPVRSLSLPQPPGW